jgi:hypothetical protein
MATNKQLAEQFEQLKSLVMGLAQSQGVTHPVPTSPAPQQQPKRKGLQANVGIEPQPDGTLHLVLKPGLHAGTSKNGKAIEFSTAGWLDLSAAGDAWQGLRVNLNAMRLG